MQVTQADDKDVRRAGLEEASKTPLPFRGMKKFLMSRSDPESTTLGNHKESAELQPAAEKAPPQIETKPVVVQPPLPPYPPPDSPPDLNVKIKQEKEDYDEANTSTSTLEVSQPPHQSPAKPEKPKEPKKTICKEFIRGNCKRAVCKFAHEVDISQLDGVFTFCWDYQNAVCTFPNCRYVHATIFEEGEFYRTGILPPHVRRHMKQQVPPPPPPAEEPQQEHTVRAPEFANPPPFHPGVEKPMPVISCVPASVIEARAEESFRTPLPRGVSPPKREWKEVEEFSSSPRDLDNEHVEKCKNCDITEFSILYHKEMVENAKQNAEEINKKLVQLNKKSDKLFNVLLTLLKPMASSKNSLNSGLIVNEKEKTMLEQLNDIMVGSNNRTSVVSDENFKNIMGNKNLTNLMTKLFCSTGDQNLSTDTSQD